MSGQGGTAATTADKGGAVDQGEAGDRPMRADARRNYERLVQAAKQVFTEYGGDASMEAIAKAAGVGVGAGRAPPPRSP